MPLAALQGKADHKGKTNDKQLVLELYISLFLVIAMTVSCNNVSSFLIVLEVDMEHKTDLSILSID